MRGLISLPYEVLANIIGNVTIEDAFSLGRTCNDLNYLLSEESICKLIIQTKAPFSNEAKEAQSVSNKNAMALRRLVKRRHALATAKPYIMAMVGLGDAFIYSKGVLCYVLDDIIRVLDLHHSHSQETVIKIPALLTQALSGVENNTTGFFNILYYSDYIISSVYTSSSEDSTAWLISFSIRTKCILIVEELDSTDKIFVRNNEQFLYYGTYSGFDHDGHKKWILRGYTFETRRWFDHEIYLSNFVGSEIGSTICFEFYEGYFYAISNQTSFEVEEIDWTSFYQCVRFPLDSPCQELIERTKNESMWRRQHHEGPIDDRWTNLRLDVDENTNEIKIVESRKEWHLGTSNSQRTYYTTDITFPTLHQDPEVDSGITAVTTAPASISSTSGTATSPYTAASSTSHTDPAHTTFRHPNFEFLPDDPLTKLLRPDDKPLYMRPPPRQPEYTHPGYDGTKSTHTLAKSRVRHYHTSAMTFLDLVDDPIPTDMYSTQRLRLRAGSRKLGPPLFKPVPQGKQGLGCLGLHRDPSKDIDVALQELYQDQPIEYWPDAQDPMRSDEQLETLYRILNPPSHLGEVEGVIDERSIVYATGSRNAPRALIFIGFDPIMRLLGLKTWGPESQDSNTMGATEPILKQGDVGDPYEDVDEVDRMVSIDRKGKGKEKCTAAMRTIGSIDNEVGRSMEVHKNWVWKEAAMFLDINLGYQFGKEAKRRK